MKNKVLLQLFVLSIFCNGLTLNAYNFGGIAISRELFNYIRNNLEDGKTILELGSGWGTGQLAKHYKVYSIEHDPGWLNKYGSHYIYAPIKDGWYDVEVLMRELPEHYDLILVDGPPGTIGRQGFFTNLHLFKSDVPIIFDDVDRKPELQLMQNTANILNRSYKIFASRNKKFGVLLTVQP